MSKEEKPDSGSAEFATRAWNIDLLPPPNLDIRKVSFLTKEKKPKKLDTSAVYSIYGYPIGNSPFYDGVTREISCKICNSNFKMLVPVDAKVQEYWFRNMELTCPACDTKLSPTKELKEDIVKDAAGFAAGRIKPDMERKGYYGV